MGAEFHHLCRHLCRCARDVFVGISPSHQHYRPLLPGKRCSVGGDSPSPAPAGTTTHHHDAHRWQRASNRLANCSRAWGEVQGLGFLVAHEHGFMLHRFHPIGGCGGKYCAILSATHTRRSLGLTFPSLPGNKDNIVRTI